MIENAHTDVLPATPCHGTTDLSDLLDRRRQSSSRAGSRQARPWLSYVVVISVLAAVSVFTPVARARWLVPVGGLIALSAFLRAIARSRSKDRSIGRHPFVCLSAGLSLTIGSEVLVAIGSSATDFVIPVALAAYPFLIAGLVVLHGGRVREDALDTVLVAAIVPSTLFAFGWLPLMEAVQHWAGSDGQTSWSSWLLLSVDALAVAIIARLAVLFRGKPVAFQMLLAAMGCMLGAHIARVIGVATGSAPAPYGSQSLLLVSFALMAGAALHPSMRLGGVTKTRADAIGIPHLLLLVTVVLVGPVFSLLRYGNQGSWVLLVAVGPAAVSLLVVAHLARMIRERQRLEYASTHDSLTGLPNRTAFHDRLALLLGRATGTDGPGVVFLDLDRFKHINDGHGHDAGDEVLREVALRLRQCVRADDTVARLAGDEFAILLAAPGGFARAEDVAQRILHSFAAPFYLDGVALTVSASMGIALAPEHGAEVETLLRNADSAMYAAKAGGRSTSRVFLPGMASAIKRHLLLEQRFRQSLTNGELVVYYQPRVDTITRELVGVEALVRWAHPQLGLIPPAAFISMAESTGAIADLGAWVLERACLDAAAWRRAGSSLVVSVNVSPRQFALQDVPGVVAAALARSGLPPEALELELTESMHLSDNGSVTVALRRIHELGVGCAVDDFGTGYSSLAVLRDYPIGIVKLDQSFVKPVGGLADAPLVRGVVQLARGLDMRVVAEGVETEAQLDFLAGILCDEVQGFLVSRAVPASQIMRIIRDGGGDLRLVPAVIPVLRDVDERRLIELLWAEQERGTNQEREPRELRFAAVVGNAAMVLAVPIAMGMGAGGGLPPVLQTSLASTMQAVGAVPAIPHYGPEGTRDPIAAGRAKATTNPGAHIESLDAASSHPGNKPATAHTSNSSATRGKPTTSSGDSSNPSGKPTSSGDTNSPGGKPTTHPTPQGIPSNKPTTHAGPQVHPSNEPTTAPTSGGKAHGEPTATPSPGGHPDPTHGPGSGPKKP
jgi:diguanylate cyclase (GGDEF)-like protein